MYVLRRHFDFVFEILKIHLKVLKEYKVNLYMSSITNLGYLFALVLGYSVLRGAFEEVFYWTFKEFLFSVFFLQFFLYVFHPWVRTLSVNLVSGDFNNYLIRPLNIFVNYMFSTVRMFVVAYSLIHFLVLIVFLVLFVELYFFKLFVVFVFAFFGGCFYFAVNCFIDSLAFFMKKNAFLKDLYTDVNNFFSQYPISFFRGSPLFVIANFIGYSYFSFYITDYYFGYMSFDVLFSLFKVLLLLIFILVLSSYFLWKIGVKKYEAYG